MRREMISGVRRPEYVAERCTYAENVEVFFYAKDKYEDTVSLSQVEMSMILTAIELALRVETTGTIEVARRDIAVRLRDILCKLDI